MQAMDVPITTKVLEVDKRKIDLLDRQGFVDQLINVAETLSMNKKSASYAINGDWGVGKTFVLELFEKQIGAYQQEGTTLNKYIVFHYNCWKYDYYEEPIVALVASLLDQIDEQTNLLPEDKKNAFKATIKAVGISLWGKAKENIKDKFGFDIDEIENILRNMQSQIEHQKAPFEYDSYFNFKKALEKLSDAIQKLSEDQTVILVVDELDRCLPEYGIKILERLHHVFSDASNVQVILAVDKHQMENTVKQIYGEKVSVERYLKKFIDFEIKLVTGKISNIVEEEYPAYYDMFTLGNEEISKIREACTILFDGIEIRRCKAIIEKSFLCHRLLTTGKQKYDIAVLCVELFFTVLKEYGLQENTAYDSFSSDDLFKRNDNQGRYNNIFSESTEALIGLENLGRRFKDGTGFYNYYDASEPRRVYVRTPDIWGFLLASYRLIIGFEKDIWVDHTYNRIIVDDDLIQEYMIKFWSFLKTIN